MNFLARVTLVLLKLYLFAIFLQVVIYEDRAKQLEDMVRIMMNNEAESLEILELIDDVQRLGLGHRFECEIRRALERIASLKYETKKSLHATALCFRLLRQHGYEVSQGTYHDL